MTNPAKSAVLTKQPLFTNWSVPWRIRDILLALLGFYLSIQASMLVLGILVGVGFAVEHLGPPPLGILRTLLAPPATFDFWIIIQTFLYWLWISALILKPHHVSLTNFFSPSKLTDDLPHPSRVRTQWAQDLHHGSRTFLVLLCLVVGLLAVTIAIIWFVSLQRGEAPAPAIDGYLTLKKRESASVLNQQLGWLRTILIVLVAPVTEELVFRGCLFAALRKRFGFWRSALISATTFAFLHRQYLVTLPQIALIGLTCAYVFERTRSLRAAAIMHACWNLLGVLVVNPLTALPILSAGTGLWLWARKSVKPSPKRTGWKWYFVIFTLVLICGYYLDAKVAWQAFMEIPLVIAIAFYAWKRPAASRAFWRVFGAIYPVWIAFLLWVNSIPDATLQPWQRVFISSEPIRSFSDLILEVLGYTLFVGPAVVTVWRLGYTRNPLHVQTSPS